MYHGQHCREATHCERPVGSLWVLVDNRLLPIIPAVRTLELLHEGKPHADIQNKKLLADNGVSLLQRVERLVLHAPV